MRKIIQTTAAVLAIVVIQTAAIVPTIPAVDASTETAQAAGTTQTKHTLKIDFNRHEPIEVANTAGDFDSRVLIPLRAAQAAAAEAEAEAAAKAAAVRKPALKTVTSTPVKVATGDIWEALRLCEAGGDYTRNSGNGYFGAYQYNIGSWANYGGFARPDLAPPAVQDAKARETAASRGFSPWPACASRLGLL